MALSVFPVVTGSYRGQIRKSVDENSREDD